LKQFAVLRLPVAAAFLLVAAGSFSSEVLAGHYDYGGYVGGFGQETHLDQALPEETPRKPCQGTRQQ